MPAADSSPLEGLRVLIAEDSWHLAEAIEIAVEHAGGVIAGTAGTLTKAESLAATIAFDAAVMDLDLRGQTSDDLALKLAKEGRKVVVVTGFECPVEFQGQVHACLTKPVPTDVLIAALARPLHRDPS